MVPVCKDLMDSAMLLCDSRASLIQTLKSAMHKGHCCGSHYWAKLEDPWQGMCCLTKLWVWMSPERFLERNPLQVSHGHRAVSVRAHKCSQSKRSSLQILPSMADVKGNSSTRGISQNHSKSSSTVLGLVPCGQEPFSSQSS